ncbi:MULTISPECIES: NAD(P)-binding protein [Geodermatophilaceae]|uniref:NAD(P)-binding protein n=1 Tax=Klenkia terrae TaxID=1052259 RepID=A0ABU8E7W3_9ACTN|nr:MULTISPECIES: NAD(P)-binding protein [Geodermatophilaceae]
MGASRPEHDAHVLVIGSGFGGSVAALRLSEKGYRITVLEAGDALHRRHVARDLMGCPSVPVGTPPGDSRGSSGSARSPRSWSSPGRASAPVR